MVVGQEFLGSPPVNDHVQGLLCLHVVVDRDVGGQEIQVDEGLLYALVCLNLGQFGLDLVEAELVDEMLVKILLEGLDLPLQNLLQEL